MPQGRRFRFAVELGEPLEGMSWVDSARWLEDADYSTLFVPDHLDEGLGPIAAMAAAAVATSTVTSTVTSTLHIGSLVLAADVRHPALLLIGGGAPRVLRSAGAHADIVGVNPSIHSGVIDGEAARDAQSDRIDQKVQWVREGAGDRFEYLELIAWLAVATLTDDALGTPGELEEQPERRRERWGYSYHVIPGPSAGELAPIVAELTGR